MNILHGTGIIGTVITTGITIADLKEIIDHISKADVLITNATNAKITIVETMAAEIVDAVMTTTDATK
jgi:hypothetical protein